MAPPPLYPGSQFRFYPPRAASAFERLETVTIIAVGPAQPVVAHALLMFTSTCATFFCRLRQRPGPILQRDGDRFLASAPDLGGPEGGLSLANV